MSERRNKFHPPQNRRFTINGRRQEMREEYEIFVVVKCSTLAIADLLARGLKADLVKNGIPGRVFVKSPDTQTAPRVNRKLRLVPRPTEARGE